MEIWDESIGPCWVLVRGQEEAGLQSKDIFPHSPARSRRLGASMSLHTGILWKAHPDPTGKQAPSPSALSKHLCAIKALA